MISVKSITIAALTGLILFSGCKKDDAPADPRDAFVGKYEVSFDLFEEDDDLEITKDAHDAQLLVINSDLLEDMGIEDLEAKISGGELKVASTKFFYNDNGPIYEGKLSGGGKLQGNELEIDLVLKCTDHDFDCEISGLRK